MVSEFFVLLLFPYNLGERGAASRVGFSGTKGLAKILKGELDHAVGVDTRDAKAVSFYVYIGSSMYRVFQGDYSKGPSLTSSDSI